MKKLLLLPLLIFFGCQSVDPSSGPSLSQEERRALQNKAVREFSAERERLWWSSKGATWPCQKLPRAESGVAFAVRCKEGIRGRNKRELFASASASKALLLVAFLREGLPRQAWQEDLRAMIRFSDNDAASRIYALLGDVALQRMLLALGMRDTQLVGYWSSIMISPADYVRFWSALPRAIPASERRWAMRLLRSPVQRWGIPDGAREWNVFFKGGWRPEGSGWLVLQGGLLRRGEARLALAVFTKDFSFADAQNIIRRKTKAILSP